MFDAIDISVHYDNQSFEIILNPAVIMINDNHNDRIEQKQRGFHNEMVVGVEEEVVKENHDTIELHHNENKRRTRESSASSKHCVASLIMALSTHPLVLSVGIEDNQIEATDYES